MTVTDSERALEIAEDALEAEYDDVEIEGEPHQQRATWVVQARADGRELNVHIEEESEAVEIAEMDERSSET